MGRLDGKVALITGAGSGIGRESSLLFAASDFARQAFGEDVHEHYTHFFDEEATAYENAVTDWERWRYFERI